MLKLISILVLLLTGSTGWMVVTAATGDKALSVKHEFGTDPSRYFLPEHAIDTNQVPNIVLKVSEKSQDPLPYYQLLPNTYMFFGNIAEVDEYNRGWNGNAGFVVTANSVVVIDSLGSPKLGQRMISTIKKVTNKPIKYLIITHNHPDHFYGAIAFRRLGGVKIIAHKGTMDYVRSDRLERSVEYRRNFIKEDMTGFEGVIPDVKIGGKYFSRLDLQVDDRMFHIYNVGQHHSYGDLVVHVKEDNVLWISDLAFNQRTTYMGDGDSRQAINAQSWILNRFADVKMMIPGHGSAQTNPFPMVTETQSYMKRLRKIMSEAITKDIDLMQAVDQAGFDDWKSSRLYELNHRTNANFVYRELEMESFND